jgi:hypothetical protein
MASSIPFFFADTVRNRHVTFFKIEAAPNYQLNAQQALTVFVDNP